MNATEQILDRARRLIADGETLLDPRAYPGHDDPGAYSKWRTQVTALLVGAVGEKSPYCKEVKEVGRSPSVWGVKTVLGSLAAFVEDVDAGHLQRFRDLVVAEVFSDFLEMAQHLLSKHYFHPAASLIGAVLEDDLRRRCDAQGISYNRRRDGLDALSQKLVDGEVISPLDKRRIAVWGRIRNDADHGNFDQFQESDVVDMLKGVTDFCAS